MEVSHLINHQPINSLPSGVLSLVTIVSSGWSKKSFQWKSQSDSTENKYNCRLGAEEVLSLGERKSNCLAGICIAGNLIQVGGIDEGRRALGEQSLLLHLPTRIQARQFLHLHQQLKFSSSSARISSSALVERGRSTEQSPHLQVMIKLLCDVIVWWPLQPILVCALAMLPGMI